MRDLIALAERCEAAEGPNFALEQEIARATEHPASDRPGFICPAYTASLDAAMMLVPENMPMWAVTSRNSATVGNKDNPLSWRFAANPALALTAACLRAIAGESHD